MKENDIIKDRYQLLRPLGAGGFGEVWLAKDQMTGTHCAVKFYVRLDDAGRSEFRGEYSRMLGIHHPNLLTASYYDEWQGRPFLVMDYCGGGAASGKVGQLGETELWRLIRDVASGLSCLHSQRDARGKEAPVIHQDIKPANFLQKDDGTWLISDFGISSRMRSSMSSQSGREVSMGGTIPYMGPERFGQDQDLVKASDIWALGASIYEMAKGKVPFGEFGGGTQRAGAEIPHLPKESWSSDLDRLVSSCLQKETWDRPSAELVAEYADCSLKGKPLLVLPHEAQVQQQDPTTSPTDTSGESLRGTANGHEWVDMGLPSGTLWATCNIGASNPDDYGSYFAWGETFAKSTYNWSTYKFTSGSSDKLTKYFSEFSFGRKMFKFFGKIFSDSLTALQTGDDPATANWGSGWRTPSDAQWYELLANTIHQYKTKNGVKGCLFTSKKNGQTIFLPAAGYCQDNELYFASRTGNYWSRSLYTDDPYIAWSYYFDFNSGVCGRSNYECRYNGFPVRPVCEK